MIKNQVVLEVKKGDRLYQLHLDSLAPLGETFDVLYEMRSYVCQMIEEAQKVDSKAKEERECCKEDCKE